MPWIDGIPSSLTWRYLIFVRRTSALVSRPSRVISFPWKVRLFDLLGTERRGSGPYVGFFRFFMPLLWKNPWQFRLTSVHHAGKIFAGATNPSGNVAHAFFTWLMCFLLLSYHGKIGDGLSVGDLQDSSTQAKTLRLLQNRPHYKRP